MLARERAVEAERYSARQALLMELEALRGREEAVRQAAAMDARAIKLEHERLQAMEERLRIKEADLDRAKRELVARVEDDLRAWKLGAFPRVGTTPLPATRAVFPPLC
jgi:hypothetical protein